MAPRLRNGASMLEKHLFEAACSKTFPIGKKTVENLNVERKKKKTNNLNESDE